VKEFECLYKCSKEASWAQWISQGCTPSCGKRQDATETFRRYCIDNKGNVVDDNFCPGASSKTVMCKQDLPRCGEWGSWTSGECSKTCGKGTHKLTRECPKNSICIGDSVKYEDCQVQECGVWSKWYTDTCSASCGGGVLEFVRVCSSCSGCEGDAEKVEACNTAPCGSGSWSVWVQSSCSKSCGGGTRTTLRRCSINGACEGSQEIVEECNTDVCDINECLANDGVGDCVNGATCNNNDGSFTCSCAPGWQGELCDVDINECLANDGVGDCVNEAKCTNTDGSFTCTCAAGWEGNLCENAPPVRSCGDFNQQTSGVHKVRLFEDDDTTYEITCNGGGWLVFQNRESASDFYLPWNDYVQGFGDKKHNFWLGLELLHKLTTTHEYELRIELENYSGAKLYAEYSTFSIGPGLGYQLTVGGYSGNAGDMMTYHNGQRFSTKDRDQDSDSSMHCAEYYQGAWWYKSCHDSNLNAVFAQQSHGGIAWGGSGWKKTTKMMIRRK